MLFDLSLEELKIYKPPLTAPDDFDAFWQQTLDEAREYPLNATFKPVDYGMQLVEIFDVTFGGYGGQPIKGWLLLPRNRTEPLPCVVEYIGYGGGRHFPFMWLLWSNAGYAHLVMDTRGQGSSIYRGDTPDPEPDSTNPQYFGFMTRGILKPATYFYRRVFTDAVRAVEAARMHRAVDAALVVVTGESQGGGIALAVSGLDHSIVATMPNVPFLCHYRRATEITDAAPYNEISHYCQVHRDKIEQVFHTLSYFDGINFAHRAKALALFSVGLMDVTCPPSTVFAAYNHFTGPKSIKVWSYNNHEGGEAYQMIEQIKFLKNLWD